MKLQLLSTDFDGTFFAEFENPPVPVKLQRMIQRFQEQGGCWLINTGRDLSSLLETLARAHLQIKPDYLVVVEREIYVRKENEYLEVKDWNKACTVDHKALFERVRKDVPKLVEWVNKRFKATMYEDPYSPFCLIAEREADAQIVHEYLEEYCKQVPGLTVVRNDIYARFSHEGYSKGTALREVARLLNIPREKIMAAGDHLNDLSMLSKQFAEYLVAPANAIEVVKHTVRAQGGFVGTLGYGHAIAQGLEKYFGEELKF